MDRQCTLCKQVKPLDRFGIYKRSNTPRSWCKECCSKKADEYRRLHPEKFKASIKKYLENHRQEIRLRNRNWQKANPEKARLSCRNWYRRRRNKITMCLYSSLSQAFGRGLGTMNIWEILGYSYEEFTRHIEGRFKDGMNWDNHGEWEIDHIIPQNFFEFQSYKDVEFKMCWRLENIQPLWRRENKQKGNKALVA